jgi:hypothetical protein
MKSRIFTLIPIQLFFIIPVVLTGCSTLHPTTGDHKTFALGQSRDQIKKELGVPTAKYMNGFNLFHDKGNEVQVHFTNGKADALFLYTFKKRIQEPWLSSVLKQTSSGKSWLLEASSHSGRSVYKTTDGSLYAFLSRGNQLLIDTKSFFEKSIHQPGKAIPIDLLPECVFAPDHNLAQLGSTEATVLRNYGCPIATAFDGAKEYDAGYQSIVVHFKKGRSDAILYAPDSHRKFNDCWISCLQELNSVNAWLVSESSTPDEVYYWTPKDDKVARLIKHRSLIVYTLDYGNDRNQATGKTDKLKSHFTASITPCASVWLGDSEAKMTKKLGTPTRDKKTRVYRDGDLTIRATFDHGACNRIIYISQKNKRFSEHWVSATLAVNSRGRSWFTFENSNPRKSFYRTYDHKFYARMKNGTDLGIMTEAVYKKAYSKLGGS